MTTSNPAIDHRQQAGSGDTAGFDNILVIAGDDQRARLVRPGARKGLEIVWEGYAASKDVRGLGQAPDMARSSADATSTFPGEGRLQFAEDIAEQVGSLVAETPSLRVVVLAPPSFALALQHALGSIGSTLPEQIIARDETGLDTTRLLAFIRATLEAHPEWTSAAS